MSSLLNSAWFRDSAAANGATHPPHDRVLKSAPTTLTAHRYGFAQRVHTQLIEDAPVFEAFAKTMLLRLEVDVYREELAAETYTVTVTETNPATWWDHFKDTYAHTWWAGWWTRRHPAQHTTRTHRRDVDFTRHATYPDLVTRPNLGTVVIKDHVDVGPQTEQAPTE